MKLLAEKHNDNDNFILNCEIIVQNRIDLWKPNEIFVNRIDNWFDEKWMEFSGAIVPQVAVWSGKTTVPPFHPKRVESSDFYRRSNQKYEKKESPKILHIYQESRENLKRYLSEFTSDGLFIWYSGNSKVNGIGTLMCYLFRESECQPFFITLTEKKDWNVSQTKAISKKEVEEIIG